MVVASALLGLGCDAGSPAHLAALDASLAPAAEGDVVSAGDDATVSDGSPAVNYGVCPDAMAATFPSIFAQMLSTGSCGTNRSFDCHSSTGALPRPEGGTGSLLDLSLDQGAVYAELLGDGGGYPSVNIAGDAGRVVPRVAPGEADASLLYIKLSLPTETDPRYGAAMPPNQLVCPSALAAVRAWIDQGAGAQ